MATKGKETEAKKRKAGSGVKGDAEGSGAIPVTFKKVRPNGTNVIIEADCLLTIHIGALKEDMAHDLNIPIPQQDWYLGSVKMEDQMTMRDYYLGLGDHEHVVITVKEIPALS